MFEVEVEFISGKGKSIVYEKISEGTSLRDLLATLSSKYQPIEGISAKELQETDYEMVILVNGKFPPNGSSTKLNEKDKISIVPVVVGG